MIITLILNADVARKYITKLFEMSVYNIFCLDIQYVLKLLN